MHREAHLMEETKESALNVGFKQDAWYVPHVTEALRRAILEAPINRRQIALRSGVPESTLSRFVRLEAGIDGTSVDKLCLLLGLELRLIEKKDR
jgi:hypothetical protein